MATSHVEKIESRFPTMAELSWGHLKQYLDDHLKKGFSLKLIRQILAAVAEFDNTNIVLKLKAARERSRKEKGRCGASSH